MSDSSNEMTGVGEATVPRKSGWRGLFGSAKSSSEPAAATVGPVEDAATDDKVVDSPEVVADAVAQVVDEVAPSIEVSHETAEPVLEPPTSPLMAPPTGLVPPGGLVPPVGLVPPPAFVDAARQPVSLPELTPAVEAGQISGLEAPAADDVPTVEPTLLPEAEEVTAPEAVAEPAAPAGLADVAPGELADIDEPELAPTEAFDALTDETVTRQAESDMVSEGSPVEELDIFMDAPEASPAAPGVETSQTKAVGPVKLPKRLAGPLAWVALLVAVGWFAVGGVVLVLMSGLVAWIIGGVAIGAGLITAYIGLTMTAKLTKVGVKIPFRKVINWSDVVGVRVVSMVGWGSMTAPLLEVADGRAIKEVELEGLASLGQGTGAAKRAGVIAAAGQVPLDGEDDDAEPEFTPRRAM